MAARGQFITVEGIEGVGKSTVIDFMSHALQARGLDVVLTREPGGTVIAEDIRTLLLAHHDEEMASDTELLLMFASRAQHLHTLIKPSLEKGSWVLCDRFTDASFAYQGGGRGIDMSRIRLLADWVHADLEPDHVILLDAPVEIAMQRAFKRSAPDRIEQEKHDFFERVRQVYLARAAQYKDRYHVVDASIALPDVKAQIMDLLNSSLSFSLPLAEGD